MSLIGASAEKAPRSLTLFNHKPWYLEHVTSTFKHFKKNFSFSFSPLQIVDYSPRESTASISKMVIMRQRWEEVQKWQADLVVLSLGKGLGFALCLFMLYKRYHSFLHCLYMY